jgi:5-methylthioadenosine/S-adenosylhomocysteine deaminase
MEQRFGLQGRIVCMDDRLSVVKDGILWIEAKRIAAVTEKGQAPPEGFAGAPVHDIEGTIYPGLIELHNHLSYNALKLWTVPKRYTNRDQWGSHPDYRKLISGPMAVLGATPDYPAAICRYVEGKCLLGGVTASQGITLQNFHLQRFYRGVVRNLEAPIEETLPPAHAKITDVEAADATKFLARLKQAKCFLLHLSEGTDERARAHFTDLKLADGSWAIASSLAGIHCTGLQPADFAVLARFGASMVWSPLSNLLLYGATADVAAAKAEGVKIALGSDWSSTGSKNLLGELKAAKAYSEISGGVFTDAEIVRMATSNAAAILGWSEHLGSLEAGKLADLVVIRGKTGDPYAKLIAAREPDINLVMIGGAVRLMSSRLDLAPETGLEKLTLERRSVFLDLEDEDADETVRGLSLAAATARLKDGLARLPELARTLENPHMAKAFRDLGERGWFLVLEHEEPGFSERPRFSAAREPVKRLSAEKAAVPLSQLLQPLDLDPLTAAADDDYVEGLKAQPNLPKPFAKQLTAML